MVVLTDSKVEDEVDAVKVKKAQNIEHNVRGLPCCHQIHTSLQGSCGITQPFTRPTATTGKHFSGSSFSCSQSGSLKVCDHKSLAGEKSLWTEMRATGHEMVETDLCRTGSLAFPSFGMMRIVLTVQPKYLQIEQQHKRKQQEAAVSVL